MLLALFFFFQAEDGIRDWSVTGVQTCALPISVGDAACLEIALECEQRIRRRLQPLRERTCLIGMRVVVAGRRERDDAEREPRPEHRGEAGEPLRERVRRARIRHRAGEAGLAVLAL